MGTRSKTNVIDRNGNVIISIYRQMDGDIAHMGKDLKTFLSESILAKYISRDKICPEYNGGMEALAGDLFVFLRKRTQLVMPAYHESNNDFANEYVIYWTLGKGVCLQGRYWDIGKGEMTFWKDI